MGHETMTSRERVLAALNHQQPDRVPIDLGGNQTGIHKFAYRALVEHLGLDEEIQIMDAVQQLARPSEEVLQRLRVDTRYIHAGAARDFDGAIVRAHWDDEEEGTDLMREPSTDLATTEGDGSPSPVG